MYVRPSAPLSIGDVIDDAIRLYRSSFSRCWVPAFVFALILTAQQIALALLMPDLGMHGGRTALEALDSLLSPTFAAVDLLSALLGLVCYGALLSQQFAVARGDEPVSVARAFAMGGRRLPGMVLATVLDLAAIVVGLCALVVPGVYLWGRLQLWMAVMFGENAAALEALKGSWRLTRGRWWHASTIFTVAVTMMIVFSLAIGLIGAVVAGLSHSSLLGSQVVVQLFSLPTNTIIYPVMSAVWISMYHDFKLRSEGGDLAARTEALSGA
jgi:hypothetical protein